MKKFYILSLLLSFSSLLFSQKQTGSIIYSESVKLEMKMEIPPEMADSPTMREMMKRFEKPQVQKRILYFDADQCVYREYEDESEKNKSNKGGDGDMHFEFLMIKEEIISHHNLKTHKLIESRDIFDKTFIITDTAKKVKWKISKELDTILGYKCFKASYMKDTVLVQAWYSNEITNSMGPDNLFGLPGTILKLDINNGKKIIEAEKISFEVPDGEMLKAPKKGKKVTKAEYNEILLKKLQEKAELEGGDGTTIRMHMD